MQYASQHDSLSSDEDFYLYEKVEGVLPSYILKMAFFHSIEEKAKKDGVETVFMNLIIVFNDQRALLILRCVKNQFVPSFLNPRQMVMGSTMLEESGVKAHIFVKYILRLLNEKCWDFTIQTRLWNQMIRIHPRCYQGYQSLL